MVPQIIQKRRLVRFLKYAQPGLDAFLLLSCALFMFAFLPLEVLISSKPATGGDTGSHYWPLVTLVEYGLPNWTVKLWNPGNLAGEPQFVHYFPLPFLVMAALDLLIPLGTAFNIGSLLALIFLPTCAYICAQGLGARYPAPILAAAAVHPFIFNESYSMWGGNTLSTLAGQFAHGYALCLLLLGIGALGVEVRCRKAPFWSILWFTGVALSHAYVLMGVPVVALCFIAFFPMQTMLYRLKHLLQVGFCSALLSLWFLIPMVDNARWNTAFYFKWISKDILAEVFPPIFYPVLAILGLSLVVHVVIHCRLKKSRRVFWQLPLWLIPAAVYWGLFYVFPKVGLVDIRAFPQVELFICMLAAMLCAAAIAYFGRLVSWILVLPLVFTMLWWVDSCSVQFSGWTDWNYSGWTNKRLYPELVELSDTIRGDFSDPRVIYEHSDINNSTGTLRVFEMLPYHANRATLESVYLQASLLSPYAFQFQALISKTPSCPFQQFPCPKYVKSDEALEELIPKLELMGVGGLILVSEEIRSVFSESEHTVGKGTFGPWEYFELSEQPALAGVIEKPLAVVASSDYRKLFWDWFLDYTGEQAFLLAVPPGEEDVLARLQANISSEKCSPRLELDVNKVILHTPCPGRLHYLKIGFHHSWKASTGDKLYMLSPGFVGLVPSAAQVELRFGQYWLWQLSFWLSCLGWTTFLGLRLWSFVLKRRNERMQRHA